MNTEKLNTGKLYYFDPYLREFTAQVLRKTALTDGKYAIVLDRTAFYPEGGGQPCDTGLLNDAPVISVQTREGEIVHTVSGDPGSGTVKGRIDWQRRFDHMQQHTGEHILSGIFLASHQAENVGFHLTASTCQIDVTLPSLSPEQAAAVEDAANAIIFDNRQIESRFVENADLASYSLRKEPGQEFEQIRLVSISDCDCCPCGGTHVSRSGEVGLIKIRGWEKRKNNIRIEFVCGYRALADYRLKHEIARTLSARFSSPLEGLLPAFERNLEKQEQTLRDLAATRKAYHEVLASKVLDESPLLGNFRIISKVFAGYGNTELQDLAARLTPSPGTVCLLAGLDETGGRSSFLFAAAPGVPVAMNELLKSSLATFGGKGGGNASLAQGGAPTADAGAVLAEAQAFLQTQLSGPAPS